MPATKHKREYLDTTAMFLSGICLLHCLALPMLLTMLPIAGVSLLDEAIFHRLILVFILPISLIALTMGCRQHRDGVTCILGVIGLTVLMVTALFGHDWFGFTGERVVTSLGGLVLATAHIRNFRCCRLHNCIHDH